MTVSTEPAPARSALLPGGPASQRRNAILLGAAFGLALLPYLRGLGHGFYLDDFTWLEHACSPGASFLGSLRPYKGQELRSLGQVLFYTQYRLFGFHPIGFNITSLLLHLAVAALVVRLASLARLTRTLAYASGILFLAGLGHYGKPEAWACAQVVVLGTLFTAAAAVHFLARHAGASRGAAGETSVRGGFPWVSYLLLAAAVLTHEITLLAPLGLALLAYIVHHPRRRLMVALGVLMPATYYLATASMHARHPMAASTGLTVLRNIFQFPAAYLFPLQGAQSWLRILDRGAASPGLIVAANVLVFVLGAAVITGGLWYARRASALMRGLLGFGFLLLLPAFAMPMPPNWIEVRYLYPATVFWCPAVCAGLWSLGAGVSGWRRRVFALALAAWFAGILTGSFYIQRRAREEAADPALHIRWERLEEIVGHPLRPPAAVEPPLR